jgi:hypothetical protein
MHALPGEGASQKAVLFHDQNTGTQTSGRHRGYTSGWAAPADYDIVGSEEGELAEIQSSLHAFHLS